MQPEYKNNAATLTQCIDALAQAEYATLACERRAWARGLVLLRNFERTFDVPIISHIGGRRAVKKTIDNCLFSYRAYFAFLKRQLRICESLRIK